MFGGFSSEGLRLLEELPSFDKERFQAERDRYRSELQGPVKEFVEALGPALRERVSAGLRFEARTHGSIGPINNDVRFDPDAPLYRDHVLLRFWEGPDRKTAPTLFVRLTAREVGFATGVAFADVAAWRAAVDESGAPLAEAITTLVRDTGAEVVGQELARVPRPWAADHPRADLLRHKWFQARWPRPLSGAGDGPALVERCAEELARASGVHAWLVEHVT